MTKKIELNQLNKIDASRLVDNLTRQERARRGKGDNWLDEVEQLARISYYLNSSRDNNPDPKPSATIEPDNLTKREKEIATLLADGHLKEDIAKTLVTAKNTIKVHCRNIAHKWETGESVEVLRMEAKRRGYGQQRN